MNTMSGKDIVKLLGFTLRVSTQSPLISFSLKPFCVTELRAIWNFVRTLLFFLAVPALIWCAENYGSVLRDCSKALNLNPKSSKAYYRSSLALLSLGQHEEALDSCDRCLLFDPNNSGVKSARDRILKEKEEAERKDQENQERIRKEEDEKSTLKMAFRVR
jgi:tetratricopeptide (TPR) repeat protein